MMKARPAVQRAPRSEYHLQGAVAEYAQKVSDNWLKIAPFSNPGMIEMLRDRDRTPRRNLMRWAGWFQGMHLISLVQMHRLTGDPELRKSLEWFVDVLIGFQDEDGYLGPFPKGYRFRNYAPNVQGHEDTSWDTSGHYYVMVGLILWYEDSGDARVLDAARKIGDALCALYLGEVKRRMVETGYAEMNLAPAHSMMLLYHHTGDERHLALARQIVDEEFGAKAPGGEYLSGNYLEAGLRGDDFFQLPKPRWESLHPMKAMAELYYVTGDERYRNAFEHFWWSIVRTDRHNTGGFTTGEKAVGTPYAYGAIESCCTLAWSAYSVEMLKLTGNPVVADELELTLLNSVIGMHSWTGRWSTYSTPMDGVRKASTQDITFQAREGTPELNCCSVHTPRGFGLLSDWGVMRDHEGVVINYYGPGSIITELDDGTRVTVSQQTDYPRSGRVMLTVAPEKPAEFAVKLRIPHWSKQTTASIDGKAIGNVRPGSYLVVSRLWNGSEEVAVELDMSLHLWFGEELCAGKASIYRGPILLTYDRRFNDVDPGELKAIDAGELNGRLVETEHWIKPILLYEIQSDGGPLRLCDYGSAGEGGTPYLSWLPVKNARPTEFSRENPLRSGRP